MEPFAQTINAAKKYVVSSTLEQVDWNAELLGVDVDVDTAVQQLKRESGKGLFVGGVQLPRALTELGLIDEYEFVEVPSPRWSTSRTDLVLRRCSPTPTVPSTPRVPATRPAPTSSPPCSTRRSTHTPTAGSPSCRSAAGDSSRLLRSAPNPTLT
jgi:hypothetical protein